MKRWAEAKIKLVTARVSDLTVLDKATLIHSDQQTRYLFCLFNGLDNLEFYKLMQINGTEAKPEPV